MTAAVARAAPPIPLCEPRLGESAWTHVRACLESGWVSSASPLVERFERRLADLTGARHAVATNTGTAALHLALLVAGVRPGDEVLVPALTFIAPVNAVRYAGAWPVFIDADPEHWQIDVEKADDFLAHECVRRADGLRNRRSGRRVRAIVPVHVLGHPADMDAVARIARAHGLAVVEDAAEGLGAELRGRRVGCLGDVGCLSFNGNKLVTAGGGGAVLTGNAAWARRARHLSVQARAERVHDEVGFNYRLTGLQAALGLSQLELLDAHVRAKRAIADRYAQALGVLPGIGTMPQSAWARSTFWLYTILVDDARQLRGVLADAGIATRPLWRPAFENPPYRRCQAHRCDVVQRLSRDGLSLPSSVALTAADQDRVIAAIATARRAASKR